ncbi:FAD/NAD(P)-binding protein [Formosa sp. PL04]|uniref:FAD/NAD(P)-binding protein n=1 Tax=Formosa sp. PL04 TaxID=3081755 RepID=UPI002980A8F9|nr:FAD/NAD(P)-binding protein [Formosa sp. PL04]MDW5290329.1 FAD/NAD(P)-binding protein [Formosa sp. PL04]
MRHSKLAIIGSGASAIYCLRHIADNSELLLKQFQGILIFEKDTHMGFGMPYNPNTTDKYNLSNISSEEIPALPQTFANWLRAQDKTYLEALNVTSFPITDSKMYSRIALGYYFHEQFNILIKTLKSSGFDVETYPEHQVNDIIPVAEDVIKIVTNQSEYICNRVIISTGHNISKDDKPNIGYYGSPWPIQKILPKSETYYNFEIGILGASLSAFDVVSSLAHRHGTFKTEGNQLKFTSHKNAKHFKITLHAVEGWLPHLQYEQEEPLREIYRHTTREAILKLRNANGFLKIEDFFNAICRPALIKAFKKDQDKNMVKKLNDKQFCFEDFIETMSQSHDYIDCFEGMKKELPQAKISVIQDKPIHWMETLDDLMYCLNFHAELLAAEDYLFFKTIVKPFLMSVIAAFPLESAQILLALHDAKFIDLVAGKVKINDATDKEVTSIEIEQKDQSKITKNYKMFINCTGSDAIELAQFPFKSLVNKGILSKAASKFESIPDNIAHLVAKEKLYTKHSDTYLYTGGIAVDNAYRVIGSSSTVSPNIYDISFTHVHGCRPYSYGLQACNATSSIVIESWLSPKTPKYSKISTQNITEIYDSNAEL